MLFASSSFVDKHQEALIGEEAPQIVVGQGDSAVSLASLRGNWVILSFWSAADAHSRMSQNQIAAMLRDSSTVRKADGVKVLSVNFDRSERLMNEIVAIDNLDENSQYHIGDEDMAISLRRIYRMDEGLRTFLINPEGELIAADPSEAELCHIMG